jgi:hypothetical protein
MPAHIHPSRQRFTCETRPIFNGLVNSDSASQDYPRPATCPEPLRPMEALPPSAQCLLHHVRGSYPSFIAHTGSCARPKPSRHIRLTLLDGSLQVVASPCWEMALPDIISAILVWVLGPLLRRAPSVHVLVSSRRAPASPQGEQVRRARLPPQCNFDDGGYFGVAVIPLCSGSHTR